MADRLTVPAPAEKVIDSALPPVVPDNVPEIVIAPPALVSVTDWPSATVTLLPKAIGELLVVMLPLSKKLVAPRVKRQRPANI